MNVDVLFLPKDIESLDISRHTVVVFDVLRATTTIATALYHGASEIRVFASLEEAKSAFALHNGQELLAGESQCLRPAGFDLGNSPGEFTRDCCAGKTIFMSTTNGTRALAAARNAGALYAAALVNAEATARAIMSAGRDVTLLCAGTNGSPAPEDEIGAAAVLEELRLSVTDLRYRSDRCSTALDRYEVSVGLGLGCALRGSHGGENIIAAGLEGDIDFAARLNACPVVARCDPANLIIRTA